MSKAARRVCAAAACAFFATQVCFVCVCVDLLSLCENPLLLLMHSLQWLLKDSNISIFMSKAAGKGRAAPLKGACFD
jgi:hypothetical protein